MAWAPKYGLKGMIDASVGVKVAANKNESDVKVMPLEFKTGKVPKDQARLFSLLKLSYRILNLSDVYHTIYLCCSKLFYFQLVLAIFVQEHCAQVILYTLLMSERYLCFIPLFCFCFFFPIGVLCILYRAFEMLPFVLYLKSGTRSMLILVFYVTSSLIRHR